MKALACLAVGVALLAAGVAAQSPTPREDRLVAEYCTECHSETKPAAGLTLVGFSAAAADRNAEVAEKVIRKLRAGMMPPPGEDRPESAAVTALIRELETRIDSAAAANPSPGWRPFQRLNRAEYALAVRDLFGLDVDVTSLLPPDVVSAGFDNIADVQTFSPTLMTGYLRAAGRISREALSSPVSRSRTLTCTGQRPGPDEQTCARSIVKALAARAFRGQGTADDVNDAMAFFAKGRTAGSFEEGIRFAVQSMLVSPRFLFRMEPIPAHAAATYAVDDRALASRLSFFLWSTGPDEVLLEAANAGALRTPAGLEAQARRLLADPRSVTLSTRFASQWLRLQDLETFVPDARLFPQYTSDLARAMRTETERFVDSIVRDDRSVLDLLTANYSFLNERLAKHYGIPNVTGSAFRRVTMPDERRGLFGQGSILASTSVADRTSPVLRGKWVMEVLLGTPPPPPPPNVPALDDSVKATRGALRLSTRQRMEEHRSRPSCNSCHRYIDPLGLSLENFDALGAWRMTDNGVPVDSVGDLYDGTTMAGPRGLRDALLSHQDLVLRTFTQNLLAYALGRRVEYTDMPTVRAIVTDAAARDNHFSAFVIGVVKSAAFRTTRPPA